jgi:restriction system protein
VPVPDYQSLMAPTLSVLADGGDHSLADLRAVIAERLDLTEEDLAATIPSGTPLLADRLHWAVAYMYQADLLSRPKRGVVRITDRGRKVIAAHPHRVDLRVLSEFPEFIYFQSRSRQPRQVAEPALADDATTSREATTPREAVSVAVDEANAAVAAEVLDRVRQREPAFLERLVLSVLTAMGYGGAAGSAERLGKTGDEGLDGVIRQDPLGLDRIYVQAKRYGAGNAVGRPEIQAFVGALHGAQADRGIFITTSRFTPEAMTYAERVPARVVLIDGLALSGLMVRYNIGVQDQHTYVIKRVDEDFFEEG